MALPGTIAPTDVNWYRFLRDRGLDEVNFWTPSAHFAFRAPEFSPFLFKLKSPHNAICGAGYFARYSALPDWLAWEAFQEGNGSDSFAAMRGRIRAIREGFKYKGDLDAPIGCIIIVNPIFFDEDDWIPQPADWPPRNLRPMRYDLEVGEGARVWQACLGRMSASARNVVAPSGSLVTEARATYGAAVLIRPRLGQGAFRIAVTDAYQRACAVTGEHSLPALDAAHIKPFSSDGPHETRNGLLLRSDLHKLFDHGYLGITPDYRVKISSRLREEYRNGRSYYPLENGELNLPLETRDRPDAALLEWHLTHVFRP